MMRSKPTMSRQPLRDAPTRSKPMPMKWPSRQRTVQAREVKLKACDGKPRIQDH